MSRRSWADRGVVAAIVGGSIALALGMLSIVLMLPATWGRSGSDAPALLALLLPLAVGALVAVVVYRRT